MGAVLTAFVLTQAIRGLLHPAHAGSWLITSDGLLPWWLTIILNVAFYAAFCWGAFLFIRGTEGRERFFMVGWWAVLLLSPLRILNLRWSMTISYVDSFGLAVALVLAISLVLRPANTQSVGLPNIELEKIEAKAGNQRLLIMGAVYAIALILGALLYFIPLR